MSNQFSPPKHLATELRKGRMIVLLDDEDRENEGDLILAAKWVSSDAINFMATHGRGLICLALSTQRCQQLNLAMMVADNGSSTGTNFTISIEARDGVTTGISAQDRAKTIATAVAQDATPDDLVQPGHVFPLRAKDGGVLVRAGHTEAACDLAQLAGFEPAAVIVEILNPDGSMARRAELEAFAQQHDLAIGSIADLIEYRLQTETSVTKGNSIACPEPWSQYLMHSYYDHIHERTHLALVHGDLNKSTSTPVVRVHQLRGVADIFGLRLPSVNKGWTLNQSLHYISSCESGAVILLNFDHNMNDKINHYFDNGNSSVEGSKVATIETHSIKSRDYVGHGIGAQILRDLGISSMYLLSATELHFPSLSGFGLSIKGCISPE